MKVFSLVGILTVALFSSATLFAQASGRISGTVVDQQGAAIPAATVKVLLQGSTSPVAAGQTNEAGAFIFLGLNPGMFDLSVEQAGFANQVLRGLRIESNRELSLPPIAMEVSTVSETVEVVASAQSVQTTNAEISNSVTNEQFRALPQLNRSVTALLQTQAGVNNSGRVPTTINGLRPAYLNITYEGVNIQDNFIRTNTADFQPVRLFTDQVAEMTITTSNSGAVSGGGAAQVNFVAPSGTNEYHGSLYWSNRNNKFAANSWFNNRDNVSLPFLNQNQFGGTFGGRIIRNKLFFYANIESLKVREQASFNRTILTDTARNGTFIYPIAGGTQRANILQLTGKTIDPVAKRLIDLLPPASAANNFDVGDSRAGDIRNTIGYRFRTRDNQDRKNIMGKGDWYINEKNTITGTYSFPELQEVLALLQQGQGIKYALVPQNA